MKNTAENPEYVVLDPRSLGRPVHLLKAFTAQLRFAFTKLVQERFNRRYHCRFEIRELTLTAAGSGDPERRYLSYASGGGHVCFSLERSLLLRIIGYRYGALDDAATAERETTTEERFAIQLGREFASAVLQQVHEYASGTNQHADPVPALEFVGSGDRTAEPGRWMVDALIAEPGCELQGRLRIVLDEHWSAALLKGPAPARARIASTEASQSIGARLNVTLIARLLEKEVTVGTVYDMRVGDVLPVSLGPSDVLIEDARLFRAAVSAHQGKLWLTSFEQVE